MIFFGGNNNLIKIECDENEHNYSECDEREYWPNVYIYEINYIVYPSSSIVSLFGRSKTGDTIEVFDTIDGGE